MRFSVQDADNYGVQKSNYFSLKDDKDTAKIRFLYNTIDDVQGVAVHEVQIGDRTVDVECLRAYNDPIDKCPLCAAGYRINAKVYIPIYDMSSNESKIWSRGKTFLSKLQSLCARYNPLVATPFEVERVGKKGDKSTTYETYPMQTDNSRIEDFPPIEAQGTCYLTKTTDELNYYLQTGNFPDSKQAPSQQVRREVPVNNQAQAPVRRRPSYNNEEESF